MVKMQTKMETEELVEEVFGLRQEDSQVCCKIKLLIAVVYSNFNIKQEEERLK